MAERKRSPGDQFLQQAFQFTLSQEKIQTQHSALGDLGRG